MTKKGTIGCRDNHAAPEPVTGRCYRCNNVRELQAGHVWPRFVYKEIVADRYKGGTFFDLQAGRSSNKQETRYWFCSDCEKTFEESYAAELLVRIKNDPDADHRYGDQMLTFCTSLSWRVAKFYEARSASQPYRDLLTVPCRRWKNFLRGEVPDVRPFSQHVFISADETMIQHYVGGYPYPDERVLITRLGPLLVVALLDRKHLSKTEREYWQRSEVIPSESGLILRLDRGVVQKHLPTDLSEALNKLDKTLQGFLLVAYRREKARKLTMGARKHK